MFGSKISYMVAGFDLAFALFCAVSHSWLVFVFVVLAILMSYVGDKKSEVEHKGE